VKAPMKRWIALWTVVAVLVGCDSEPALLRQMRIERLISALRGAILESVEAEKSAVLATTDEESQAMARETEKFAADINQMRGELRPLIVADGRKEEIDRLDAFDTAWKELESVDQRLLALAVANTNLKATRLSAVEGQAALDHLTGILLEMQRTATQPETIRALAQPGVAAYRVQSLLMVHISSAEDAEMTRLEQQIASLSDEVDRSLAGVRNSGEISSDDLAKATQAWSDYRRVVGEVLRLSRENTNVISFDVSIHEKRRATKDCLNALTKLATAVQSRTKATR
jgi:hypothetical protein